MIVFSSAINGAEKEGVFRTGVPSSVTFSSMSYTCSGQYWANAGVVTDPRTFNDNTSALFNILQAAADLGIKRIISASSNQLYGFAGAPPLFVPVDEAHPARPVNSYALSKLVGEQTAEYFSRTRGLEVLSFRIMGTRAPEELPAETVAMGGDPAGEAWLLWTRTDARDVATACRQAVEVDSVESSRLLTV
eukprot:COSAG06_NODE_6450_length_2927_cov_6.055163_2_plen_191_part_00